MWTSAAHCWRNAATILTFLFIFMYNFKKNEKQMKNKWEKNLH